MQLILICSSHESSGNDKYESPRRSSRHKSSRSETRDSRDKEKHKEDKREKSDEKKEERRDSRRDEKDRKEDKKEEKNEERKEEKHESKDIGAKKRSRLELEEDSGSQPTNGANVIKTEPNLVPVKIEPTTQNEAPKPVVALPTDVSSHSFKKFKLNNLIV